jgi:signal transduction histidine kinase
MPHLGWTAKPDGFIDYHNRIGGEPVRVIGAVVDVQSLKELAERESLARSEAEEANRAMDDFLAMLGHELRNPLGPIMTALHLIRLRGSDGITREIEVIERSRCSTSACP